MRRNIATLLIVFGASAMSVTTCAAERLAVGPDKPHKTISSALAEMKDGDYCLIDAGVYRERIDVSRNNVTLIGQGRVIITGCDEAGEMEPIVVNGVQGLAKAVDGPVYDAFLGEQYLTPARYPNKTVSMTSNEDWEESFIGPDKTVTFREQAQKKLPDLSDGYYVGMHGRFKVRPGKLSSWYSISLPIMGLDERGNIRVNDDEASSGFMGNYGRGNGLGYIILARAVLDAPGEWYSDGKEFIVIPPKGGGGGYELRTRLYGAVVTGHGVRLENIRFRGATARVDGNDVSLVKCAFEYTSPFSHNPNPEDEPKNKRGQSRASGWGIPENGTAGVFVGGDGFVAENCRIGKSWWCGMMVRGNNARIENCLVEDVNWMARRCAGIFSWGDGNTIRYCTVRNVGGTAIEGGNAGWVNQYAKNNVWEYNYLEDVARLIVDQGFFYVNHQSGSKPKANSIWRYNVGKGSRGPDKGEWTNTTVGYYVDNSSSGYHIHNNIAVDAAEAIRYNDTKDDDQAGRDILYHNNTFYKCDEIGFGSWTPGKKAKLDAEVMLINNLSAPETELDFSLRGEPLGWKNNPRDLPASVLKDPENMDFTPVVERLKTGGVPVRGQEIPYIGAVDPAKGMWRYGADESKLPRP